MMPPGAPPIALFRTFAKNLPMTRSCAIAVQRKAEFAPGGGGRGGRESDSRRVVD
jgi:hypothetical protein